MQTDQSKINRMKELAEQLSEASKAYYALDTESMTNREYDEQYDELTALEEETGVILSNSPTTKIGYEAVDELPKEKHGKTMLSLGKTKNRDELSDWLKGNLALLSWKLDGLTIILHYYEGKLAKAITRGNGEIGEVVTNNAKVFQNIPLNISYQGELVLRGEAVISYSDFEKINAELDENHEKYKNPRNLCSGSVRQLNNEITSKRHVQFYAFSLVNADGKVFDNSREKQMQFLEEQGFAVVHYKKVTEENILEAVANFEEKIEHFDLPSDGLVLIYDDIAYGESLGKTSKFPRDSIAFKWQDEIRETTLQEIEWSPSRTGLINPVAIFLPVELEGTTVSRASVHNISILRGLKLGIGDQIRVYKANMIIPQIAENLTGSDNLEIPDACPVCGEQTEIKQVKEVQALYCTNPDCSAKKIKSFTLFVSRDAMNMDGFSEATLEKLIAKGFIHEYVDIYHLDRYHDEIVAMDGFGEKSYLKLIKSIETSRKTTLPKFLYSLGIANIGLSNAKMICKEYGYDLEKMQSASIEELSDIDGVGDVIATTFLDYFKDEEKLEKLNRLLPELQIEVEVIEEESQTLSGIVFVITGSLEHYGSRNELKDIIERMGGKVTGSVTSKTNYLINNDIASNSSKNKKAKELGVEIITEETFMEKYIE